jgi:hypothetical protein
MQNETKNETPKRPVGRPRTFPAEIAVAACPSRLSQLTIERLREMATDRPSPFGLDHNSFGAEAHRIIEQAYNKWAKDKERRAARAASRKETAPKAKRTQKPVEPTPEPPVIAEPETTEEN